MIVQNSSVQSGIDATFGCTYLSKNKFKGCLPPNIFLLHCPKQTFCWWWTEDGDDDFEIDEEGKPQMEREDGHNDF